MKDPVDHIERPRLPWSREGMATRFRRKLPAPMTSEIPRDIEMVAFKIADGWSHNDEERADMQEDIQRALFVERERCAKFGDAWDNPSAIRLAAGEMTAQEMRTARAVARGIAAAIRQQATP